MRVLIVAILALGILSAACTGGTAPGNARNESPVTTPTSRASEPRPTGTAPAGPGEPTVSSTPSIAPVSFYPPGTRSNVPAVDRVLAALESGDQAIERLIVMSRVSCSTQPTVGQLRCPEGATNGDIVEAFLWGSCAPNYAYGKDEATDNTRTLLRDTRLVAVYESPKNVGVVQPSYDVVLAVPAQRTAVGISLWVDSEGGIRGATSCGLAAPADLRAILPPQA